MLKRIEVGHGGAHLRYLSTQEAESEACQKLETNLDYRVRSSLKKTKQPSKQNACLIGMKAWALYPKLTLKMLGRVACVCDPNTTVTPPWFHGYEFLKKKTDVRKQIPVCQGSGIGEGTHCKGHDVDQGWRRDSLQRPWYGQLTVQWNLVSFIVHFLKRKKKGAGLGRWGGSERSWRGETVIRID